MNKNNNKNSTNKPGNDNGNGKVEVTITPLENEYVQITTKFDSQIKTIKGLIFNEEEIESIAKIRRKLAEQSS